MWAHSLREIHLIIKAASRRDARLAWLVGAYTSHAFHNPKKYPEDPGLSEADSGPVEDPVYVRAFFKALAQRSKHGH